MLRHCEPSLNTPIVFHYDIFFYELPYWFSNQMSLLLNSIHLLNVSIVGELKSFINALMRLDPYLRGFFGSSFSMNSTKNMAFQKSIVKLDDPLLF